MKMLSIQKGVFCAILSSALAFLVFGCSSEGYRVDLKPQEALEAVKPVQGKYFIASLRYFQSDEMTPSAGDFFIKDINALNYVKDPAGNSPEKIEMLRAALQERCRERFPERFAADGELAMPVEVAIKAYKGDQQMIGPMICGFTMGLVPGPFSMEHIYEVSVSPCRPMGVAIAPALPCRKVAYTQVGWAALFPTGLIPYFWSDTDESPVCYSISSMAPMLKQISGRTISLMADAIAVDLAAKRKDLAGTPEQVAGPGSIVYSSPLPASKTSAPGGGIVAPAHDPAGQAAGLNGL